ncbi:response regulator [Dyella choica]|uniref:Response regulator n=1 Tax=Dyella choica TaxID=1927959 RepID=A0A3S0S6H0_9GAMM|nr:response regulator [Dyella choica]RUL68410.1 response regulator [Dyella choica]
MNASSQLTAYASHVAVPSTRWAVRERAAIYRANATPTPTPARILVIDEDAQSRSVLVSQLKALDLEPLAVPDSLAALNVITYQAPDLILIACDGPDTAAYKTVMRLVVVSHARQACIPIIILAGERDVFFWQLCLDDDIVDVLQKPVRAEKLQVSMGLWLDLPPTVSHEPNESLPPFEDTPQWYRACLAAEIHAYEQALATHDTFLMVHYAHRTHGVALVLGIDRAAKLADRLEQSARGHKPLKPDGIRKTLAALKEAIARHFE